MNEDTISLISPGPYVWGIIPEGPPQTDWILKSLSFGSGDVHAVLLPGHEKSVTSEDPTRPEHAVIFCMTGNGPNSKNNAQAIACLLTMREIAAQAKKEHSPKLEIPTTPNEVAWAEYAMVLEHALGISDPVPERLRNWRPWENCDKAVSP